MSYFQLTSNNIVEFLSSLPQMQEQFSSFENLNVSEITDGNMNYAFVVSNMDVANESVFCKQSPPYIKVMGEDWPLTRKRMTAEIRALSFQARVSPQTAPQIYYQSEELSLLILQNLQGYNILRNELIKGLYFPNLADDLSSYLAATLFHSSDFGLTPMQKHTLVVENANPDMCMISEDFIFTYPFEHHQMNNYNPALSQANIDLIQKDPEIRAHVAQLKYKFVSHKEALIHGDLHTGSIMLNQERTYVIDAEFACVGPMSFDIGALIANLYLSYFSHAHKHTAESDQYSEWLLRQVELIWDGFSQKFVRYWRQHETHSGKAFMGRELSKDSHQSFRKLFFRQLFRDSLGFAAIKIIRRILGVAKVADLMQFEDELLRAKLEGQALNFAKLLLLKRAKLCDIKEVNQFAREA